MELARRNAVASDWTITTYTIANFRILRISFLVENFSLEKMRHVYGFRNRPNPDISMEPMANWELEAILDRETRKNKAVLCFPQRELVWGPLVEIGVVETFDIQNSEFHFCESLWQIVTPKLNRKDINFVKNVSEGNKLESWDKIRDFFIHQACKYQTSVKLWDAQQRNEPLHQKFPRFLKLEDLDRSALTSIDLRRKMGIANDEGLAKRHLKHLLIEADNSTVKVKTHPQPVLCAQKDITKLAKNMDRILNLCKHAIPVCAFEENRIDKNLR